MGKPARLLPPAALPWAAILSFKDPGCALSAELRAEQWGQFIRLLPLTMGALLALAAAIAAAFLASGMSVLAIVWLSIVATVVGGCGALAVGLYRGRPQEQVGAHAVRWLAIASGAIALLFNTLAIAELGSAGVRPAHLFSIGSTQLAMIACGALLFAPVPLAALAYLGVVLGCYVAAMAVLVGTGAVGAAVFVLPAVLGIVVVRAVLTQAAATTDRVQRLAELRGRGDVITMLLKEVEQNGRDWLWEIDADARVRQVSPRFEEQFSRKLGNLTGRPFLGDALKPGGDAAAIRSAVAERRTFRTLACSVEIDGETRWWSLSGSPRFSEGGVFMGFIGVGADVTEARRNQEQIERMATRDGLTGLANRSVMRSALQAALEKASRSGGRCALVLFDLDRFKAVNDTLGHQAGDELLREASQRLLTIAGDAARCARLGGDEFAFILSDCDEAGALAIAEKAIASLGEPFHLRGAAMRVGASAGVSVGPDNGRTIDELVRCADLALYDAKKAGRAQVRSFDPALQAKEEQRLALETALRSALKDNQLSLAFQPIYNLATGDVRAFEALLRWRHPVLGSVSPADFIPLAEETGLINPIGEWVVRTACAWAARWPDHIGVAVNLSPSQLLDPKLPGVVLHALASQGVAPARLELEITENVFLHEGEATRTALAQLAALGVRLGLDDFGTGYSSLGYLRNSIFDTIKIDRSFVRDAVVAGSQSAEIVRHIVSLANNLGMDTVAEGAETEDELDTVRQLGCGNVQGFLTGRPMSPEDATELVSERAAVAVAA